MRQKEELAKSDSCISDLIREFGAESETVFDLASELDDGKGGQRLVVSHRELAPELPELLPLARNQKPAHTFHDVAGFGEYIKAYGTENLVVVANVELCEATANLDEQAELGGCPLVRFRPLFHPLFSKWNEFFSEPQRVLAFAMFAMENRRQITVPEGRELAHTLSQLTMSSTIEKKEGIGKKSINGVIATVTIQGERKDVPVELPDFIEIQVPIFLTDEAATLEIDLLVYASGDQIMVRGTFASVDELLARRFMEDVESLKADLAGADGVVVLGNSTYRDVEELEL